MFIYIRTTVVVFSDGVRSGTSIWGIFVGVVSREPFVLKIFFLSKGQSVQSPCRSRPISAQRACKEST